jgi:hypothetical protein
MAGVPCDAVNEEAKVVSSSFIPLEITGSSSSFGVSTTAASPFFSLSAFSRAIFPVPLSCALPVPHALYVPVPNVRVAHVLRSGGYWLPAKVGSPFVFGNLVS